ncbi:hypothetical protein [Corynebacterium ciconiae]|nr:hypothetical protein [Corynebacterium ciconiae]
MTPTEQREHIGACCTLSIENWVIVNLYWSDQYKQVLATVLNPIDAELLDGVPLSTITPRQDLPPAWNPDGTPIKER